jgi:hypothetical protein
MILIKNKPTKKELDKLWQDCIKTRAGWKSEVSGLGKDRGYVIQGHHIFHKQNLRLRYSLEFGICLTKNEHMQYHEFEKRPFITDRHKADDLRARFLAIRKETEDKALAFKRQTGGMNLFLVKEYLKQKLKEFEKK